MEQELKAAVSIEKRVNRAYEFADLSEYSFKDRMLIRAADLAFYFLINLVGRTARFEVTGWENHEKAEEGGGLPIYVFWHDRIFLTTYWWRKRRIVVMTSRSFDGEYIARFIRRFRLVVSAPSALARWRQGSGREQNSAVFSCFTAFRTQIRRI